jgi:catechol 2,3-dioxygenase-like lactoylglutathione lyase family enzyme
MLADSRVTAILPAVDLARAKEFYEKKLGLLPIDAPVAGAMFKGGQGTVLALYQRDAPTKADHTVAGWVVDDIEAVVDTLRRQGVVFEQYDMPGMKTDKRGIATLGSTKSAWFKDTEGNILSIFEVGR